MIKATTTTATDGTSRRSRTEPGSVLMARAAAQLPPPSISRQRRHEAEQAAERAFIRRRTKTRSSGAAQLRPTPTTTDDADEPQNLRLSKSACSVSARAHSSRRFRRQCRQSEVGARATCADLARAISLKVCLSKLSLAFVLCLCFASFSLLLQFDYLEAKSIDESAPTNGRTETRIDNSIGKALNEQQQQPESYHKQLASSNQASKSDGNNRQVTQNTTLSDLIDKATTINSTTLLATNLNSKNFEVKPNTISSASVSESVTTKRAASTTQSSLATEADLRTTTQKAPATTTTTAAAEATTTTEADDQDDPSGAESDDNDAEGCQGLSSGPSAPGKGPSDNERLVNLQACLQKKVKLQLMANARNSMEMFDRLSLSGSCTASLMNLMSSLGELKGFAFKFLDASAKIPSGMMSGLLSDFGDFEQCLSIRSSARVDPSLEAEEGGYSGKYCLLNIKMRYRVKLGPDSSAPEGIYPDGVLWDELVRNYWTSNSSKGFQVGVCLPSRCDHDDLNQMVRLIAERYHVVGEVSACQDSNDVRRQQSPDLLQLVIIYSFLVILTLNLIGTYVDRYKLETHLDEIRHRNKQRQLSLLVKVLVCFSIRRNWFIFLHSGANRSFGGPDGDIVCSQLSPLDIDHQQRRHKCRSSVSLSTDEELGDMDVSKTNNSNEGSGASSSFYSSSPSNDKDICQELRRYDMLNEHNPAKSIFQPLSIRILPESVAVKSRQLELASKPLIISNIANSSKASTDVLQPEKGVVLSHLWGLKLLVIIWITVGHSFLYPSANNYQHYRSIINMNITRNSVWFATTNFILGIDMLLYMTGLMFVLKLAHVSGVGSSLSEAADHQATSSKPLAPSISLKIARLISTKMLRFWPTYLSVIALAIVAPLISNGPMWPEMVTHRLGDTCRANWWANLLMINNLLDSSRVCLPASWFISVTMQCFLIGSAIVALANRHSTRLAVASASLLIAVSSLISFWLAYANKLNAPAIRMDESFVMELDENIFRMYTSTINNLGPFLVGMLGGFLLLTCRIKAISVASKHDNDDQQPRSPKIEKLSKLMFELNVGFAMALIGIVVLSSVFFTSYTPLWSAVYWSCHRIGWALVTGYLIHQCATGKWKLIRELLSLSTFIPLGRLIFIAYLVHPMFIHIHSGLVRDGLHVSLYNMLNIYITRLVMTFALALCLHLFVELPFCSMEESLLNVWLERRRRLRLECRRQLERGQQQQQQQQQQASDNGQRQPGSQQVVGEPLLRVASGDKLGCAARTIFERQETTETTLSESG